MIQPQLVRYGSLDSYVIDTTAPNSANPNGRALVVLCHGYGAPGSDLVGVVDAWLSILGEKADGFRFLCPIAPNDLAELGMPGGRAWWSLNMSRLMEAIETDRFEDLHQETPPGIDEARQSLSQLVSLARQELAEQDGVAADSIPLAIGGFSQGAMLTMDTALRGEITAPKLLMQFSGTVICQTQWVNSLNQLSDTRVYQAHGTIDPILPYKSAERLRDLMKEAKVDLTFHSFHGPHTIDPQSIMTTAQMLQDLVV